MPLNRSFGKPALLYRNSQRLVGKYMLSRIQRRGDLPAVLAARGNDRDRVNIRPCQHLPVILVNIRNAQFLPGIFQFSRYDGTCRRQFCIGDLERKIARMYLLILRNLNLCCVS